MLESGRTRVGLARHPWHLGCDWSNRSGDSKATPPPAKEKFTASQRTLQHPYANSSLITRPLLAIFIGRPLLLVNTVDSEMPSALQMLAITSWLVYGSVSTAVPSLLVAPMAWPPFMPPPPTTTLQLR